jgi:hypothetical protein
MASRTKYPHSKMLGFRYLRFQYWTPIRRYADRYQMVFSQGDGTEALCFFNASKKSPRGRSSTNNYFYPPPHGEFSRWYEEVANFPRPRSNSERCSGLKKLMEAQFWQAEVTERWDDFGNRIFEIALMTLRPCPEFPAKEGWKVFEYHKNSDRDFVEDKSNDECKLSEQDLDIPF